MSFSDLFTNKYMTSSGGLLGAAGGIMAGLPGAFGGSNPTDYASRRNWGWTQGAGGVAEVISGAQGAMTGGVNLWKGIEQRKKFKNKKEGEIIDDNGSLDIAGGTLNGLSGLTSLGTGITDIIGGVYAHKAANALERANGQRNDEVREIEGKAANTGIAGGILNAVGSAFGLGGGIVDSIAGFKKSKTAGWAGIANTFGNLLTMAGGITGAISGGYTKKDLKEEADVVRAGGNVQNRPVSASSIKAGRLQKASGWLNMIGSLAKGVGSGMGYAQDSSMAAKVSNSG